MYYTDYLEHYGVKGMKWGVRKDEDASYSRTASTKSKNNIERVATRNDLAALHNNIESSAQAHFKKRETEMRLSAYQKGQAFDLTGEPANKLWEESYREAVNTYAADDTTKILLVGYELLRKEGISRYFNVGIGKINGKKTCIFFCYRGQPRIL